MGKEEIRLINILKYQRGILTDFLKLVQNIIDAEKKYHVTSNELNKLDFSNKNIISALTKEFTPQELGLLLIISNQIGNIQQDLLNFGNYDSTKKQKLVNDLTHITNNLNQLLGEKGHGTSTRRRKRQ